VFVPSAIEPLFGETAIETKLIELTFRMVEALVVASAAVIVLDPALKPLAKPEPVIPAIADCEELQLTEPVRSRVLLSL
jgi:hypothetical protein